MVHSPRACRIFPVLALGLCVARLHAADPVSDPSWTKAADNKIFAQTLVNETMAAHPELVVIGVHATAPGAADERMIASNLDRIGKKDDDDDIGVAKEKKTILAPNLTDPAKFEVLMPLLDAEGRVLGSLGLVFKYKAGDDQVKMLTQAIAVRGEFAKRLPDAAALYVK